MIDLNICPDCICLPICLNKRDNKLIWECSTMKTEIRNLSLHIVPDFKVFFTSDPLDKIFFIVMYELDYEHRVIHLGIVDPDDRPIYLFYFNDPIPEKWADSSMV